MGEVYLFWRPLFYILVKTQLREVDGKAYATLLYFNLFGDSGSLRFSVR